MKDLILMKLCSGVYSTGKEFWNKLFPKNEEDKIKCKKKKIYLVRWSLTLMRYVKVNFDVLVKEIRLLQVILSEIREENNKSWCD